MLNLKDTRSPDANVRDTIDLDCESCNEIFRGTSGHSFWFEFSIRKWLVCRPKGDVGESGLPDDNCHTPTHLPRGVGVDYRLYHSRLDKVSPISLDTDVKTSETMALHSAASRT